MFMRGTGAVDLEAQPARAPAHHLYASATETEEWTPGAYSYVLRVRNGDDVREIESGRVQVLRNIASAPDDFDARSHAQRTLDAINAVIEKRATTDQQRYVIETQQGRRELWRIPIPELLAFRDKYQAMVNTENAEAAGRTPWGPALRYRI